MSNKWKLTSYLVFNGKGRMCRRDFIMFNAIFYAIGGVVCAIYLLCLHLIGFFEIDPETNPMTNSQMFALIGLVFIVLLLYLVPFLAMGIFASIRRLHDINLSGWWILLFMLISLISRGFGGTLCTIFLMVKKGSVGENKYGVDPLEWQKCYEPDLNIYGFWNTFKKQCPDRLSYFLRSFSYIALAYFCHYNWGFWGRFVPCGICAVCVFILRAWILFSKNPWIFRSESIFQLSDFSFLNYKLLLFFMFYKYGSWERTKRKRNQIVFLYDVYMFLFPVFNAVFGKSHGRCLSFCYV